METVTTVNDNISRSRQDNIAEEVVTPTKDNDSSPTGVVKKVRYNTIPQTDDHCIVSIIYNAKVLTSQRSGRRTNWDTSTVHADYHPSTVYTCLHSDYSGGVIH